jgi:flotillin
MAEMMIKVLPEIAGKIAEPLSQIDKITIIGGGSEDNGIKENDTKEDCKINR